VTDTRSVHPVAEQFRDAAMDAARLAAPGTDDEARTQAEAATHLRQLADALAHRGLRVPRVADNLQMLRVSNPAASDLSEVIRIHHTNAHGWEYLWSWREVIGPATKTGQVADQIAKVLRLTDDQYRPQ
jgi:hypothetical protein